MRVEHRHVKSDLKEINAFRLHTLHTFRHSTLDDSACGIDRPKDTPFGGTYDGSCRQ